MNPDYDKLNEVDAALYPHLTVKLLYLSKITQPESLLAVSFLTKSIINLYMDDWKKLGQCLQYLSSTKHLPFALGANSHAVL
jgi:hypothetical protein